MLGKAVSTGTGAFDQGDHEIVAMYRYTLAPGTSTGWHVLVNPGFSVQTRGSVIAKVDCGARGTHEAGRAYLNPATETAQLVANTSSEPAEFLSVALSMPNYTLVDLAPATPALPPSDCPDQLLS